MKRSLILLYLLVFHFFITSPLHLFDISSFHLLRAQTHLYVRGSAVPGGVKELTRFPTSTSGRYTFKFHGKLLPGDLYITTTEMPRPASRYYVPKLVDTDIVTQKAAYTISNDSTGGEWAVLFEADNYRFTVDTYSKEVSGELFTRWYEAWICGGCVEDEQGKDISGQEGHWQITSGKQMEQNWEDPNIFEWTGLLKAYSYNAEPKRFKINGQYGWGPKVLHPFTQDASILTAKQMWYNGSEDYKWVISKDGYYRIRINVFEETIEGKYLGAELPDDIHGVAQAKADIRVSGRKIVFRSESPMTVMLLSPEGIRHSFGSGTDITLTAPGAGIYILNAAGGGQGTTWKVAVR